MTRGKPRSWLIKPTCSFQIGSPGGRSLDAVRGRLVVGDSAFELLAAALTDPATSAAVTSYGELFGARAEWAFDPIFAVDAYALARVAQAEPRDSLDASIRGDRKSVL